MDIQKRRQADRERYWRDVERNRAKRRVEAMSPEKTQAVRDRDRARYENAREKILGRKRESRTRDPERFRQYGRNHYRAHRDAVKRSVNARWWRGAEEAKGLWEAIRAARTALNATERE